MWSRLKLSQQGLLLVGVPIGLMLVSLLSLLFLLLRVEKQAQEADRSKTIIAKANSLVKEYYDASSQLMMYKYARTKRLRQRFETQLAGTADSFQELHDLLKDDPDQLKNLADLRVTADQGMTLLRQFEKRLQEPGEIPAIEATFMYKKFEVAGSDFTEKLRALVVQETAKNRVDSQEEEWSRLLLKSTILLWVAAAVAIGVTLAVLFTRTTTQRLSMLMDNTQRLSKKEPLLPALQGEDEIARLDSFFHQMAEALAAATRKERAILDNAVDVICSINADGYFTAANPATLPAWGYTAEELVGMPYAKIVVAEDVGKFKAVLDQIKQDTALVTFENRINTADHNLLYVLWSLRWSQAEGSFFCVAHDITDRKKVEQLKQEFVAVMSHELRTPLTSLQATLTLLSNGAYGELNSNGERRVKSAERGIARLIMLINDLLDIEKMEAGKLSMSYHDVELSDVVERSLDSVHGFAEEQGVNVKVSTTINAQADAVATGRHLTILADADRLVQVMVNLLSNAIKYSEDGAQVEIDLSEQGDQCQVQVIDHGAGIPEGYEDKIFTKYEQAPSTDGKRRLGTGLGLPICKAIVEQHGGTIGVLRTQGGGSTFWFRIPRVGASGDDGTA